MDFKFYNKKKDRIHDALRDTLRVAFRDALHDAFRDALFDAFRDGFRDDSVTHSVSHSALGDALLRTIKVFGTSKKLCSTVETREKPQGGGAFFGLTSFEIRKKKPHFCEFCDF